MEQFEKDEASGPEGGRVHGVKVGEADFTPLYYRFLLQN
jgi:hypothetical protein